MISIIGHTGFIGSNLLKVYGHQVNYCYNSSNIHDLSSSKHGLLIIAGPSGIKWKVNKDPSQDIVVINSLCDALRNTKADYVLHLSTCDVFDYSVEREIFEYDKMFTDSPYGKHRRLLEEVISDTFSSYSILRLPTVYGVGMKKNLIFDLMTNNKDYLKTVNPFNELQWINVSKIPDLITYALSLNIRLLNVATMPFPNFEIFRIFNYEYSNYIPQNFRYFMKTLYDPSGFLINREQVLNDISVFKNDYFRITS